MTAKPHSAARVSELSKSIHFYRDQLGFAVQVQDSDVAVVNAAGWPMLLAGPAAGDITPFLSEAHAIVKPGATIHLYGGDLDKRCADLKSRGIGAELHESAWGDHTLIVPAPDGYTVSFWTESQRTHAESIALYAAGPDALLAALSGLTDSDLDWRPTHEEWSIREIVHHVVDSDTAAHFRMMMALAEPGRTFLGNPYDPGTWASSLDYAGRDVEPAVALLTATRAHILQLLHHLPDAMERSIKNQEGQSTTVETFVSMLASHLMIHVEQVNTARRALSGPR